MALRPTFIGFNLDQFKSLYGSKDKKLLSRLTKWYDGSIVTIVKDGKNEKVYYSSKGEDHEVIKNFIMGQKSAVELENNYPYVITNLIFFQSTDIVKTDSQTWRYYHNDYFKFLEQNVSKDYLHFVEYMLFGRMFFSEEDLPTTEFPYAYLTNKEVDYLLNDIRHNPKIYWDTWEFGHEFRSFGQSFESWLSEIKKTGADLFFDQG